MILFTFKSFTIKFARPLLPWYLAGMVALALTNIISLTIPLLAKKIINALEQQQNLTDLKQIPLYIIGLGALTIIIRALSRILIFWPGRKLEANSKSYLFHRMLRLPQTFYDKYGLGDLISKLANDIGQLRAFYAFGILQLLNLIFLLGFTVTMMLSIHAALTLVCLLPIFAMMLFMKSMMNSMHRISLANQQAVGKLTNRVTESFVNVHAIKANSAEQVFCQISSEENEQVYKTNIDSVVLRTALFPLMGTLMNLSQVIVIFYGGYEVMHQRLSIGDILAFNVYIAYLGFPLSAFGIIISLYQRCRTALVRITDIETDPAEGGEIVKFSSIDTTKPILKINDLCFWYEDKKSEKEFLALDHFSLSVFAGERIGIFGSIGSGKTTLFNLITRILTPPAQSIFYHGIDVNEISPQTLRRAIAYVQQTVQLFSETVEYNLALGLTPPPSLTEMRAAAEKSQILEEIENFESGWKAQIGERGLRLSGGQKQRLSLARAFIRHPVIYLLDDVISAVDEKTEELLLEKIFESGQTLIMSSHRVSALLRCDRLIIMDKGRVIDQGVPAEVIGKHPTLAKSRDAHEK